LTSGAIRHSRFAIHDSQSRFVIHDSLITIALMSPDHIPVRSVDTLECRTCGAGAPVDEHFCPNCSRILALGRHGDYFSFLGLPRQLNIDPQQLERNFRELSRKFHPDYFYNASSSERLASLERSSYLNDAYRALKNPAADRASPRH